VAEHDDSVGDSASEQSDSASVPTAQDSDAVSEAVISLGSGRFVQSARAPEPDVFGGDEGITLNFEDADLREFLAVVFDKILRENYLVDPAVRGTVTLHTSRPLTTDAVIPTVEAVLQLNGAAIVLDDGVYRIIPFSQAERSARSPTVGRFSSNRNSGYGIQVVPLEHASAEEIGKVLAPLVSDGSSLRVDAARNLLILSGPKFRIEEMLATIRTFDVDWLQGMSFALFRLEYADAISLVEELQLLIGVDSETPMSGIVKLMPIARLNAILVIAHRPDHINKVRSIVEEFDWGMEGSGGRRLFVYELENGKAENIARSLQEIYAYGGLPGYDAESDGGDRMNVFRPSSEVTRPSPLPAGITSSVGGEEDGGVPANFQGNVKIIADTDNNAILVLTRQEDYRPIEAAIRRLDMPPRQVLIEATIAEVSLNNTLDYGVRWFLEKSNYELGFNAPVPSGASGEGLAFAFLDQDSDVSAFFDMLSTESQVKFLSTPQVMVLDNQTANIRVGDQIPVTTRSSQSTSNPDAPIVTEVQFRDTGTLLTVTPRINAGGQVTLEISQEVSLPGTEPAVGGGGNVSIAQRTITSSVIVQSGQTVVLGGLILENSSEGVSGVPILMDLPLIGKVFSTTSQDTFRTELLITVKPTVVGYEREMREVTEELRMRMRNADDYEQEVRNRD
jgi:general secretion pathway protein D